MTEAHLTYPDLVSSLPNSGPAIILQLEQDLFATSFKKCGTGMCVKEENINVEKNYYLVDLKDSYHKNLPLHLLYSNISTVSSPGG